MQRLKRASAPSRCLPAKKDREHRTLECSHEAERHVVRSVIALLRRQVLANLAQDEVPAGRLWQMASQVDRVARPHRCAVVALGLGHRRQRVAQLL